MDEVVRLDELRRFIPVVLLYMMLTLRGSKNLMFEQQRPTVNKCTVCFALVGLIEPHSLATSIWSSCYFIQALEGEDLRAAASGCTTSALLI